MFLRLALALVTVASVAACSDAIAQTASSPAPSPWAILGTIASAVLSLGGSLIVARTVGSAQARKQDERDLKHAIDELRLDMAKVQASVATLTQHVGRQEARIDCAAGSLSDLKAEVSARYSVGGHESTTPPAPGKLKGR